MLQIYKVLRIIALLIILIVSIIVLFCDNTKIVEGNNVTVKNIELVFDVFNYDPYNEKVLYKVNDIKSYFSNIFITYNDSISNIINDKVFIEDIFSYILSKKMNYMPSIVSNNFYKVKYFKDFIIIDNNKEILYKHNSSSFAPVFYTNETFKIINNNYAIISKYNDPSFDFYIQAITIFDQRIFNDILDNSDFGIYIYVDSKIINNTDTIPEAIENMLKTSEDYNKSLYNFDSLEIIPLKVNNKRVVTIAVNYPSRDLISVLLSFLKIFIPIALIIIIIIIDRAIIFRIKNKINVVKRTAMPEEVGEEKQIDRNLNWIENYIKGSDDKK